MQAISRKPVLFQELSFAYVALQHTHVWQMRKGKRVSKQANVREGWQAETQREEAEAQGNEAHGSYSSEIYTCHYGCAAAASLLLLCLCLWLTHEVRRSACWLVCMH